MQVIKCQCPVPVMDLILLTKKQNEQTMARPHTQFSPCWHIRAKAETLKMQLTFRGCVKCQRALNVKVKAKQRCTATLSLTRAGKDVQPDPRMNVTSGVKRYPLSITWSENVWTFLASENLRMTRATAKEKYFGKHRFCVTRFRSPKLCLWANI